MAGCRWRLSTRLAGLDWFRRVHDCDPVKTSEVLIVQGEHVGDTMNAHGCHEPGIMHLNATNVLGRHQASPLAVNLFAVGEQRKLIFDESGASIGLGDRQAKAVPLCRTGANIPEFGWVFGRVTQFGFGSPQGIYGRSDDRVVVIVWLGKAEQNVAV